MATGAFTNHFSTIFTALGLPAAAYSELMQKMNAAFNDETKYKIINDNKLATKLDTLKNKNEAFNKNMSSDIKNRWTATRSKIAQLIVLLLVKRIEAGNCDAVMKTLIDAFDANIDSINTIVEDTLTSRTSSPSRPTSPVANEVNKINKIESTQSSNPQSRSSSPVRPKTPPSGSTSKSVSNNKKAKYLKYKMKYLNLKNKMLNDTI